MIYEDKERCATCGGRCCKDIYLPASEGGSFPDGHYWFEEWCDEFHYGREEYDVLPLFDPLVAHGSWEEAFAYRDSLIAAGIDINACEYWDKTVGCTISRALRPPQCLSYKCW